MRILRGGLDLSLAAHSLGMLFQWERHSFIRLSVPHSVLLLSSVAGSGVVFMQTMSGLEVKYWKKKDPGERKRSVRRFERSSE